MRVHQFILALPLMALAACAGDGKSYVLVKVDGASRVAPFSELHVTAKNAGMAAAPLTVKVAPPPADPFTFSLSFDSSRIGALEVDIDAWDTMDAVAIAHGSQSGVITPGAVTTIEVVLAGAMGPDGFLPPDLLAPADLSTEMADGADLAQTTDDLVQVVDAPLADAPRDLATSDLTIAVHPDLAAPILDLTTAPPRDFTGVTLDLVLPDLALPDLATPDLALPDLALPDLSHPDFILLDLTPPSPPPVINSVSPAVGPKTGGTQVTIAGSGFLANATVTFGGTSAPNPTITATSISVKTPAHAAGAVDVTVTNVDAQSATATSAFTYARAVGFTKKTFTSTLNAVYSLGTITADNDKFIDLIVVGNVITNVFFTTPAFDAERNTSGTGFSSFNSTQATTGINFGSGVSVAALDWNKSSGMDFAMTYNGMSGPGLLLFAGDGTGDFAEVGTGFSFGNTFMGPLAPVSVGDFNGDGWTDIGVSICQSPMAGSGSVSTWLNPGNSGNSTTPTPFDGGPAACRSAAAKLINNDVHWDLLTVSTMQEQVNFLQGQNTQPGLIKSGLLPNMPGASDVAIADWDGDGALDVLTAGTSVVWRKGNGTKSFDNPLQISSSASTLIGTGDFDKDGLLDAVVLLSNGATTLSIIPGSGAPEVQVSLGAAASAMVVADFNNDNLPDIALTLSNTTQFVILYNSSN